MSLQIILAFLGGQEIIIIALILLLLFGGRKIPELMKGLGKGIREFKDASKGGVENEKIEEKKWELVESGGGFFATNFTN